MRGFGFICFLMIISCSEEKIPSKVKAKIVAYNSSGLNYEVVEYKYLTDPLHMDGQIAAIRGGSIINADLTNTDVIHGNLDKIFLKKGSQVRIDYTVDNGVIHAENFDSLAMLTLYYNIEKIVDFWIEKYNFTFKQIPKFNIHYNPTIQKKDNGITLSLTDRLNAAYFGGIGSILSFKTSSLENLPFNMNPAILSHEFGHKIFDIVFAQEKFDVDSAKSEKALEQLSGINEGWSDYAAWLFVQRVDLFTQSLDVKLFKDRIVPVSWTSSKLLDNPEICDGKYYCKGSILASALYELANDPVLSKEKVTFAVLDAFIAFRDDWKAHRNDDSFDYYYLLNRIVGQLSGPQKTKACTVFQKWFDDETNKEGLNSVCS